MFKLCVKTLSVVASSLVFCFGTPLIIEAHAEQLITHSREVSVAAKRKTPSARANSNAFAKVCKSVQNLPRTMIYKAIASPHIRGDARASSTSFIGANGAPNLGTSCLLVYDKKGNQVHSLGYYGNWVGGPWRYYGGFGCGDRQTASSVANKAKKNTGSSEIYVKISSSSCVKVNSATGCYNSASCS